MPRALRGCVQGPRILLDVCVFFWPEDAGSGTSEAASLNELAPGLTECLGLSRVPMEGHSWLLVIQRSLKCHLRGAALPDHPPSAASPPPSSSTVAIL